MKNKNVLIWLAVIVALLSVSIGYAAVSRNFKINIGIGTGDVSGLSENLDIYFSELWWEEEYYATKYPNMTIDASVDSTEKSLITNINVTGLNKVGEGIVLYYTIKNDSENLYAWGPFVSLGEGTSEEVVFQSATPINNTSNYPYYVTVYSVGGYYEVSVFNNNNPTIDPKGGTTEVMIFIDMVKSPDKEMNFNVVLELEYKGLENWEDWKELELE